MARLSTRTSLLAGLAALALLAGCTSANERRNAPRAGESFALSVARAAGMRELRDVEAPDDPAALRGRPLIGPGGALGIANIAFGNPVVGLLGLTGGGRSDGSQYTHIVAFAPESYASTAAQARERFFDVTESAFVAALESAPLKRSPEIVTIPVTSGPSKVDAVMGQWKHGRCLENSLGSCLLYIIERPQFAPSLEQAPSFVQNGRVWRFDRGYGSNSIVAQGFGGSAESLFTDLFSIYLEMSKRLPPWAFVYVAPNDISYRDADGELAYFPVPAVLNQGRAHFFVKEADRGDGVAADALVPGDTSSRGGAS